MQPCRQACSSRCTSAWCTWHPRSGARLAFDLAADLTDVDHRSVVEQLLNDGKCTMTTLAAMGRTLAHPARPGSLRFMTTVLSRSGRPADSHPEVLIAGGLRRRGVPVVTQVRPVLLPGGSRITLDMACLLYTSPSPRD